MNPYGKVVKVTSVAPGLGKGNIEIGFSDGWRFTAHYKDFTDALLGIPLTPEILEKNGWKRYECSRCDTYLKDIYTIIENIEEKGIFYVCSGRNNLVIRKVQYVHQLQHLLFGLGLPKDLKV